MNYIKRSIKDNSLKFYCDLGAFVIALIGFILYLTTGVIHGFTNQYSTGLIIIAIIGLIANLFFSIKRIDTLEMIPFISYIICIFLFLSVNANYLAAVVRAIDITSVSTTFVLTIVCFVVAAVAYLIGFVEKKSK